VSIKPGLWTMDWSMDWTGPWIGPWTVSIQKDSTTHACLNYHLCASHACEKLPRAIENMVRDIYSFFSHSAKRLAEFEKFQHFVQVEPHKILKPAQTRWLSLQMCVSRILEQWDALELFFADAAERERQVAAENVASTLKNPIVKLYFQFLDYVLHVFQEGLSNLPFLCLKLSRFAKRSGWIAGIRH